ncbi:MAG: hypothetical protein IJ848_03940 [Alphaproteobacteria bacterium]|nr:hypothetical protein [Alphaproteobacteria bacterium]
MKSIIKDLLLPVIVLAVTDNIYSVENTNIKEHLTEINTSHLNTQEINVNPFNFNKDELNELHTTIIPGLQQYFLSHPYEINTYDTFKVFLDSVIQTINNNGVANDINNIIKSSSTIEKLRSEIFNVANNIKNDDFTNLINNAIQWNISLGFSSDFANKLKQFCFLVSNIFYINKRIDLKMDESLSNIYISLYNNVYYLLLFSLVNEPKNEKFNKIVKNYERSVKDLNDFKEFVTPYINDHKSIFDKLKNQFKKSIIN